MRAMLLAFAIATVLIVKLPAGGHATPPDSRYERAHAVAVKYRAQRDDLQLRLTRRVLETRGLRRMLLHKPSSLEAIGLAAIAYHVDANLLYRIASCESTGTRVGTGPRSERSLYALAKNRSSTASGLGQFLDSTWRSSPFSGFSVFSPYANALAMGYEVAAGHAGWQWAASRGCWG